MVKIDSDECSVVPSQKQKYSPQDENHTFELVKLPQGKRHWKGFAAKGKENFVWKGFGVKGKENFVCRLRKSLYGLKQALRQWYRKFDSFMMDHGYDKTSFDHYVFVKKFPNEKYIILLLYMLMTCWLLVMIKMTFKVLKESCESPLQWRIWVLQNKSLAWKLFVTGRMENCGYPNKNIFKRY